MAVGTQLEAVDWMWVVAGTGREEEDRRSVVVGIQMEEG